MIRWRPVAVAAALGVALLARPASAQHPPVSGFFREADWVTLSDFRHVTAIAAGDEEAYVGTTGGVEILSGFGSRWSGTVTAGDGLPSSVVTALAYEPRAGSVWIGTPLGLAIYEPFRGEVVRDPLGLGAVPIRALRRGASRGGAGKRPGSAGALLPGEDVRLYVLAGGRWYRSDPFSRSPEPVSERDVPAQASEVDLREIPFLSGDVVRGERSDRPESFRVTAVAQVFGRRLVLGTWGANAYLYAPSRLDPEPVPYGLAGPGGGALGWDGERLWFSNVPGRWTAAGALPPAEVADRGAVASATANLEGWTYAYPGLEPGLPSDRVYDIAVAGGRTLFATDAGLAVYDAGAGGWRRLPPLAGSGEVLAVEAAADGLWLGTRTGLVALRWGDSGNGGEGPRLESASDSLSPVGRWLDGREVRSLAGDGRDVYAGTDLGLFRLSPRASGSSEWMLSPVKTTGKEIRDLALLDDVVVAATDRGVEILPRETGEPLLFLVGEGQLKEPPLTVAADASNVWIGTRSGVARWDRARRLWTEYGLSDGLPDVPVLDILVQDSRTVWFSTPGGATRFDLGEPPRAR